MRRLTAKASAMAWILFAIIMFVTEKIPLGLTSMIVCVGLCVTGVLDVKTAFSGFIDSNVILFVAMFIVGGALFETGMANEIGGIGAIATAAIIFTGILGNMFGCAMLKVFRIRGEIAQGVAFGTASHVIGTPRADQLSPLTGAVSSLSLTVAGILTTVILSVIYG